MSRPIPLAVALAMLTGCATTFPATSMEACESSPCDPPPPSPEQQVRQRAVTELECASERIELRLIADGADHDHQTWDARGCGRTTVYRYYNTNYGEGVYRNTPVVASPFE